MCLCIFFMYPVWFVRAGSVSSKKCRNARKCWRKNSWIFSFSITSFNWICCSSPGNSSFNFSWDPPTFLLYARPRKAWIVILGNFFERNSGRNDFWNSWRILLLSASLTKYRPEMLKETKRSKIKNRLQWYFVTKIVLTYYEKKLFLWLRIFLKFEAEGRLLANFMRSLVQFIHIVKGKNNFL